MPTFLICPDEATYYSYTWASFIRGCTDQVANPDSDSFIQLTESEMIEYLSIDNPTSDPETINEILQSINSFDPIVIASMISAYMVAFILGAAGGLIVRQFKKT